METKKENIIIIKRKKEDQKSTEPQSSPERRPELKKRAEPPRQFHRHHSKERRFPDQKPGETRITFIRRRSPERAQEQEESKSQTSAQREPDRQEEKVQSAPPEPHVTSEPEIVREPEHIPPQPEEHVEEKTEAPEESKESGDRTEEGETTKSIGDIEFFSGREDIIPFRAKRFFSYRKKKKKKVQKHEVTQEKKEEKPEVRKIKIFGPTRVADLSKLTGIKSSEIIKRLMELGREVTINNLISPDEIELICAEYGIEVEREEFDETRFFDITEDPEGELKRRPAVVVVMGHVDHGKTTLLDAIRETNVAEKEVGGITQSIGAYTVEVNGQTITFIDTPGHEAFTEMRARGAKVADIAILVVAADEGVMPQTEEAINHARAAELPIIVAVNKIDKPGANPERVKNQLANLGLVPEEWGGDVLFSNISAKKRIGIDDLLEKVLLQAEILNLRANPSRPAEGVIIESSLDKGLGATATVIIQRGTLKRGDVFVAGLMWGRVRNMFSDKGTAMKEVPPGFPAKIVIGGDEIPQAGDKLYVVRDEEIASRIVEERRMREIGTSSQAISLEEIYEKIKESGEEKVVLPIILKAASAGALDAVEKEISGIKHPNVEIKVIHKGIGIVSQSDVNLAAASKGIIIGYGVNADKNAHSLAKTYNVQIRLYKIIYEIVDDIKKALRGILKPKEKEVTVGRARILKIFNLSVGRVLGCYAESGKFIQGLSVRVKRDGEIIGVGKIVSLKRFKDFVQEINEGDEFGLMIDGVKDARENDIIECFRIEKEDTNII